MKSLVNAKSFIPTPERGNESISPCPECGQISMIRTKGDCKLKDGFMVPDLERWQCSSCKANFFEVEDLHIIADFRAKTQQ